jgi:sensor domain CHASE-containing protein
MTTQNINDKLKGSATLWQLIFSVVSVIVVVLAFAFSLRADVNSALRETTRNATDIIEVKDELHKHEEKVDVIQRQILDAINDLKLSLKDKADRR